MASSKSGSSGIVENWLADLTNGDGFLFSSASCIMSFSSANHGDKNGKQLGLFFMICTLYRSNKRAV